MSSICWGPCGKPTEPYLILPSITFVRRFFRCDECGVEWQDTYSLLPQIAGMLIFRPLTETITACLPLI